MQHDSNQDGFYLSYFKVFDMYLDESLSWILSHFINNQKKGTVK